MVESKRLNRAFKCIFCETDVNPYVIFKNYAQKKMLVECPNCNKRVDLMMTPDEMTNEGTEGYKA